MISMIIVSNEHDTYSPAELQALNKIADAANEAFQIWQQQAKEDVQTSHLADVYSSIEEVQQKIQNLPPGKDISIELRAELAKLEDSISSAITKDIATAEDLLERASKEDKRG